MKFTLLITFLSLGYIHTISQTIGPQPIDFEMDWEVNPKLLNLTEITYKMNEMYRINDIRYEIMLNMIFYVQFDTEGCYLQHQIARPNPLWDASAEAPLQELRISPAICNGQPQPCWLPVWIRIGL